MIEARSEPLLANPPFHGAMWRLVVLALLVPSAAAGPLQANLVAEGPVEFTGFLDARYMVGGAEIVGDGTLATGTGAFEVVEATYRQVRSKAEVPVVEEVRHHQSVHTEERIHHVSGPWSIHATAPNAMIRILGPPGARNVAVSHEASYLRLEAPRANAESVGPDPVVDGDYTGIQLPHQTSDISGALTATGDLLVLVHNATVTTGNISFVAGERPTQGAGTSSAAINASEQVYLLLKADGSAIFSDARLFIRSIHGTLEGHVVFMKVTGTTRSEGVVWDQDAMLVAAEGSFDVWAKNMNEQQSRWVLTGDARSIAIDGRTAYREAAMVAGAGVLALFVLVKALPALAAWLGRHRVAPLENPLRRRMIAFIAANPGCRRMDLARALETTRHNVMFHINVLRYHGMVDVIQKGRFEHYMPNSGTFRKMVPAGEKKIRLRDAMALLSHPVRAQITRLLDDAPRGYADIQTNWEGKAPGKSLLSYHMKRLEREGMVQMNSENKWHLVTEVVPFVDAAKKDARKALTEAES